MAPVPGCRTVHANGDLHGAAQPQQEGLRLEKEQGADKSGQGLGGQGSEEGARMVEQWSLFVPLDAKGSAEPVRGRLFDSG